MAKETYYFSHDSNAITDTKILNMRADYGLEGYGLYWAIIEMMRNEEDYKLSLNKNAYRAIKTLTNTTIDIEKFIKDCIEDYGLFKQEEERFFSESLLQRMLKYEKKKESNRENGKLGGRPKKSEEKPNGFENETETKAKQSKIKESKVKENKIKRNKVKEIYNSICTNLPQVQKLTKEREKAIDTFLKEFTVEQFEEICKKANSSSFLKGKNDRNWKADFDFLMRTNKATNILEGKYDNVSEGKKSNDKDNKKNFQQREYNDLNQFYTNVKKGG